MISSAGCYLLLGYNLDRMGVLGTVSYEHRTQRLAAHRASAVLPHATQHGADERHVAPFTVDAQDLTCVAGRCIDASVKRILFKSTYIYF